MVFSLTNVLNQYATTTTLAVTPAGASQTYGQAITLTATETPASQAGSTASGSVLFFDGATQIASVTLSGGGASTTVALPTLTAHAYKAVYTGDTNFTGSTSAVSNVTVTQATTTLSATAVTTNVGVATTVPVTVTGQHAGAGVALPGGQ